MPTLNREQFRATRTVDGKILVLAGAGSGKTSVLIDRCIHLIEDLGISPNAILGLTFTNKAAEEMRHRISLRLGKEKAKEILLSTFHSFCFWILKREIHHLGYTQQFSLYDDGDMERLVKTLEKDIKEKEIQQSMKAYNAVNFDGLLSLTVQLFKEFPDVLKKYQDRFAYIMIDEYQDTNAVQFELASLLSQLRGNLFVVGDDDQSIYSWRGAEVKHILQFQYHNLIKLEQNYRSTKPILDVANAVIKNNRERHNKILWSDKEQGDLVRIFHAPNEANEAEAVVERILLLRKAHGLKWNHFAILYRSNNLSRHFEMALLKAAWKDGDYFVRGIPYRVIQGMEFFERAEVKDFLAYLRAISNPLDSQALLRIINYPRRGISVKTIDTLTNFQKANNIPLWEILKNPQGLELTPQAERGIAAFVDLLESAKKDFANKPLQEAMQLLVQTLDLKRVIESEVKSEKAQNFKWENIQALISMTENYESDEPSLHDFLTSALLDQNRKYHKDKNHDRVNLLTFHSAKGLEFPACFLVALEDRYLPHERSQKENGIEEERRLFYVAITRAQKYLTLSMAVSRTSYGKETETNPSRFLFEIPKNLLLIEAWDRPTSFEYM